MIRLESPRDVLLFDLGQGLTLVSAIDSCGGIGEQKYDALCADPVIVGHYTARVALLEIMSVGAEAAYVSLAVCSGPKTAEPIIAGVQKAVGNHLPLMISTEKNIPTAMTGIGVTVTGFCKRTELLVASAKPGDALFCAGLPLVGQETLRKGAQIFETAHLAALLQNKHVHAVIPVGSMGIAAETAILARESGLACSLDADAGIDLQKSAGPATCAVFAADAGTVFDIGLPVVKIGTLK
jgi:hypothetical protein